MSQIISRRLHLIKNSLFDHNIFPDGSIVVASKHCENVQDLLVCGDRYNIIQYKTWFDSLFPINSNHEVSNVSHVTVLLQVYHISFAMLAEESVIYVGTALALHQMLPIWLIAKNVKSKVLGPKFHENQDYITIKVISRRMFILARLQLILLINAVMRK